MNKQQRQKIRRAMLRWFDAHKREMPWRETRDPYAIWVSEIMLQQTQVATVIGYYNRFMKTFPTVGKLAAGKEDAVLKLWEGLGYYSRARNLLKAAKMIVRDYNGALPAHPTELSKIPGIGRYTAGAIASIAFGLKEPVLDGNVMRVLSRLFCIEGDPKQSPTHERLWELAAALLSPSRPGDFNQAMMELGAMICKPRNADCPACPLRKQCAALAEGRVAELPHKPPSKKTPHHTVVAAVISRGRGKDRRILIQRRPAKGLLGGLWEFPGGKVETGETLADALRREIKEELGAAIRVGKQIAKVNHAYSHFKITLHAFACTLSDGKSGERKSSVGRAACLRKQASLHAQSPASPLPRANKLHALQKGSPDLAQERPIQWVRPEDLKNFAFPKANHAILKALTDK